MPQEALDSPSPLLAESARAGGDLIRQKVEEELEILRAESVGFATFVGANNENAKGVTLALMSSIFIGASFIIKKKGLMAAGATGTRASAGGFSYLQQPLWWVGMLTMIGGEFANLAAYAYAPAIVVTPLGASTIVISSILANCFLDEVMHVCGVFGVLSCVAGSVILVRYAPSEQPLNSVEEIWVGRRGSAARESPRRRPPPRPAPANHTPFWRRGPAFTASSAQRPVAARRA